jgi:nucleoside-diphosphate-sugar epimerase
MLIHRVLTSALGQTPLRLFGNGHQQRNFTYVDVVVRATIAAALAPVADTVINVGGGTSTSIADVLDVARQLTGRPVPVVRSAAAAGDAPATLADIPQARELLGWKREVPLVDGMKMQLRHLRKSG